MFNIEYLFCYNDAYMQRIGVSVLKDLYMLWKPVFPYLTRYIKEIYKKHGGEIIEVGPFCGSIFSLKTEGIGNRHTIATFPSGMGRFYRQEALTSGFDEEFMIVESDDSFSCFRDEGFDLIIFRGALFFPDLFNVDYMNIYRMLKTGGIGIIGGGFGKYTPRKK